MQKNFYSGIIQSDATKQQIGNYNYAKFTLRVDDGKDKENKRKYLWLDVLKLDKEGKLTPYLVKDSIVEVEGKISVSAYKNKEGEAVATMTLWCNELSFLNVPRRENTQGVAVNTSGDDSDLPF